MRLTELFMAARAGTKQLCGSHIRFYACLHRGVRLSAKGRDTSPEFQPLDWCPPFACAAPSHVHLECPYRDVDGARHRAAGIEIPE